MSPLVLGAATHLGATEMTDTQGEPGDLPTAFLTAAEAALKQASAARPDPAVMHAFALGWQMAELYRPGRAGSSPADPNDLPGLSGLSATELTELRATQLQAGLAKLAQAITAAGLEVPDAEALIERLAEPGADRDGEIRAFHVTILSRLTAADFRLGKAYGLGRALADTTRAPSDPVAELGRYRVATVSGWIRDLASAFPAHAAHPVADSLSAWSDYCGEAGSFDPALRRQLSAQGRLWRNLLSGERAPTQTLETLDYLRAGEGLIDRSVAVGWSFVRRYWYVVLGVLVLFFLGIALLASSSGWLATASGAVSLLASLGLTWKGIGTSLGTAAVRLEMPLWQAELDRAVYRRITPDAILARQPKVAPSGDEPSLHAPAPPAQAPTMPRPPIAQPPTVAAPPAEPLTPEEPPETEPQLPG